MRRFLLEYAIGLCCALVAQGCGTEVVAESEEDAQAATAVFNPPPLVLPESIYVDACHADPDSDRDEDMLKDVYENRIAEFFKPYYKFDTREPTSSLRPNEPVTTFQVTPHDNDACIGAGCQQTTRITIRWGYFFIRDGGYQIAGCFSTKHWGDNQPETFHLESSDGGVTWKMVGAPVGVAERAPHDPTGPLASLMPSTRHSHPVVYFSAGKHHQYWSRGTGSKVKHDSGSWGCDDATNGQHVASGYASLISNFGDGRFNNVGESAHHDPQHFVGCMSEFTASFGLLHVRNFEGASDDYFANITYAQWQAYDGTPAWLYHGYPKCAAGAGYPCVTVKFVKAGGDPQCNGSAYHVWGTSDFYGSSVAGPNTDLWHAMAPSSLYRPLDDLEANDSALTAAPLPLGAVYPEGTSSYIAGEPVAHASVHDHDAQDFYTVRTHDYIDLDVSVGFSPGLLAGGTSQLGLGHEAGKGLEVEWGGASIAEQPAGRFETSAVQLCPGTHDIRVGYDPGSGNQTVLGPWVFICYDVGLEGVVSTIAPDRYDSRGTNDTVGTATPLTARHQLPALIGNSTTWEVEALNFHTAADVDHFTLVLPNHSGTSALNGAALPECQPFDYGTFTSNGVAGWREQGPAQLVVSAVRTDDRASCDTGRPFELAILSGDGATLAHVAEGQTVALPCPNATLGRQAPVISVRDTSGRGFYKLIVAYAPAYQMVGFEEPRTRHSPIRWRLPSVVDPIDLMYPLLGRGTVERGAPLVDRLDFDWERGGPFALDVGFSNEHLLSVALVDVEGQVVAGAEWAPERSERRNVQTLEVPDLAPGAYTLEVHGPEVGVPYVLERAVNLD